MAELLDHGPIPWAHERGVMGCVASWLVTKGATGGLLRRIGGEAGSEVLVAGSCAIPVP
jgi:hypothetical protein